MRSDTTFDDEQLKAYLSDTTWWPALDQNDQVVKTRATEIVSHIADEDRPLAESTLLFTIYDDETHTWGIVSRPAKHSLAFRFKNPFSERLKAACEKLVAELQPTSGKRSKLPKHTFRFSARVEVFEPTSQNHAFSGEILPPKRFFLALQERRTEAYVGAFTALLALLLLGATSPIFEPHFLAIFPATWRTWASGNLERFSTAALVTLTISSFEVFLHWLEIRRKNYIRWTLE